MRSRTITILYVLILTASLTLSSRVSAAINPMINYQGRLTDSTGTAVSNGSYNMRFRLYTSSTGGSPIFTETLTGSSRVPVTGGLFSVMLGSTTDLTTVDFNQTLYLGVEVGGTDSGTPTWDGEMSPRKIIGSVPAAFVAKNLDGGSATTTNLLVTGSSTLQAFTFTTATGTAATTTNLFSTTASSTNLFSTSGNIGSLTAGVITSGLINGQTISSAANFTGTLTATGGLTTLSNLLLTGSSTLQNFTALNATTTNATTTTLAVTTLCLTGDTCRTTWPTGGSGGANSKWATSTDNISIIPNGGGGIIVSASSTITGGLTLTTSTTTSATTTNLFAGNLSANQLSIGGTATSTFSQGSIIIEGANSSSPSLSINEGGSQVVSLGDSGGASDIGRLQLSASGVETVRLLASGDSFLNGGNFYMTGGNFGVGTSTPKFALQIASSTRAQLTLSDASLTSNHWSFRNAGGVFYLATSSPSTFATSTTAALSIDANAAVTIGNSFFGAGLSTCNTSADKLLWSSGFFSCGTDQNGGGAGSELNWTFFNNSGIRLGTSTNQVLISASGATATTSLAKLEVRYDTADNGSLLVTGSSTLQAFTFTNATGTSATTTNLAVTTLCLTGDTCRTTWPTSGGGANSKWATSTTDSLAIYTNSAERVGIGTSTPQTTLSIATTTNASSATSTLQIGPRLLVSGSAGGTIFGAGLDTFSGNLFDIQVNGSSLFRMDSGGEILRLGGNTVSIGGSGASWYRNGVSAVVANSGDNAGSDLILRAGTSGASNLIFQTASTERGRLNATGFGLGIDPSYTLEVNGTASTTNLYARYSTTTSATTTNLFAGNLSANQLSIGGTATSTFSQGTLIIEGSNSSTPGIAINEGGVQVVSLGDAAGASDNGRLTLGFNGTDNIRLLASGTSFINGGNLGLGTESPNYTLEVYGTASTTNLYASYSTTTNATTTNLFSTTASSTNLFSTSGNIGSLTAGVITSGLINGQTISSAANFTGTLTATGGLTTLSNLLLTGSSTLQNFTGVNSTTTSATTTNLFAGNLSANQLSIGGTATSTFSQGSIIIEGANSSSPSLSINEGGSQVVSLGDSGGASDIGRLQLSASGVETVRLLASGDSFLNGGNFYMTGGNFGVGTSTPKFALQLASSTRAQLTLSDASLTSNHWSFRNAGGVFYLATSSPSTFATSTTAALSINTTGGVGINTNSALTGSVLNIASNANSTNSTNGILMLGTSSLTSPSAAGTYIGLNAPSTFAGNFVDYQLNSTRYFSVDYQGTITTLGGGIATLNSTQISLYQPSGGTVTMGNYGDTGASNLVLQAGSAGAGSVLSFQTDAVERARISSAGMGLGTTTPRWALQIASSTRSQLTLSDASLTSNHWSFRNAGGVFYLATSSPSTFATSTTAALSIDSTNTVTFGNSLATCIALTGSSALCDGSDDGGVGGGANSKWATSTTDSLAIYTNSAERVGIGTSTPQTTLSIATTTNASSATSTLQIGPRLLVSGSAGGTIFGAGLDTFSGNLFDIQVNGSSLFRMDSGGEILRLGGNTVSIGGSGAAWYRNGVSAVIANSGDNAGSDLILRAGASGASSLIFQTEATERGRLSAAGMGLGTTTPQWLLQLASSTRSQLTLSDASLTSNHWSFRNAGGVFYLATSSPSTFSTSTTAALTIDTNNQVTLGNSLVVSGNLTAGNATTSSLFGRTLSANQLNIGGTATSTFSQGTLIIEGPNSSSASLSINDGGLQVVSLGDSGGASDIGRLILANNGSDEVRLIASGVSYINGGNVGIGTTTPGAKLNVIGALCVDDETPTCADAARTSGTIYSVAALSASLDLAESYPTKDETLGAGEIVMLDGANSMFVSRAVSGSSMPLVGIVSTNPGFWLGGFNSEVFKDERKLPIALSGRVPTKVNNEGGAINIGDRIALSSVSGVGKKATSTDYTVGIALESMYDREGVIEVFVNLDNPTKSEELVTIENRVNLLEINLANAALAVSTSTGTSTDGFLASVLDAIGATISDGILYLKNLVVETLTVGKSDKPAGITLYDSQTGAPYCLIILNGTPVSNAGACGSQASSSQPSTNQDSGSNDQTSPVDLNNSTSSPEMISSPEPEVTQGPEVVSEPQPQAEAPVVTESATESDTQVAPETTTPTEPEVSVEQTTE